MKEKKDKPASDIICEIQKDKDVKQPIFILVAIKLSNKLQTEIINKANKVLNLYNHGMKKIIFPDIDEILKKLV